MYTHTHINIHFHWKGNTFHRGSERFELWEVHLYMGNKDILHMARIKLREGDL